MNLDQLIIKRLHVKALIGFMPWELNERQPLIISTYIYYDPNTLHQTDEPEDCIDYKKITDQLTAFVENHQFNLLERLAEECASLILAFDTRIHSTRLHIEKPSALRFCDAAAIEITRFNALPKSA